MKKILVANLRFLSKLILLRCKPLVIGITGSMGKTSTRDALSQVLSKKYRLGVTYKNYNNEIGLPLTIIGAKSPGRSIFGWLAVFLSALKIIIFGKSKYPEVLILEMGVDRPGDLDYLCSLAKPKIGIVTAVSYSHLEFFGSLEKIKKEKETLIKHLDQSGLAVLNYDNKLSREMAETSPAKVISYGLEDGADLQAQDIVYNFTKGDYELTGINFKLNFAGSIVPVFMKNIISPASIYAALAAAACGLELGINLIDVASSLADFSSPKGRMNVLAGINHSFIIDDTYNSSPEPCLAALDVLGKMKKENEANKYAILGDMLEIGDYSKQAHELVAKKILETKIDYLITVGERSKEIAKIANEKGLAKENIYSFENSYQVGGFMINRIKAGDLILVKGSQGVRMERVVKELMIEKDRASELLVRQGKDWIKS